MVTLEQVKSWLRIDYDEDDIDVQMLIDTAKDYIINATNELVNIESNLFNLAMRMLIQHWYDNRCQFADKEKPIPQGFQYILQQLQYCYDYTVEEV